MLDTPGFNLNYLDIGATSADQTPPEVGLTVELGMRRSLRSREPAVSLSGASTQTVTVNYAVSGGTATGGVDYTLDAGALTFSPARRTKASPYRSSTTSGEEADETVVVTLSSPVNATWHQLDLHLHHH